ncbi:MAG: hypothetical protein IH798_05220 [Gemmatimonadetes bacterium]|nr:hypothetical protein [Gemmatimonadota bacterium]
MIELKKDSLVFRFPDVHKDAVLRIGFQRTLRIPDDDEKYPLPPGLGLFPLRHVDDFPNSVSELWMQHGGVMLPMYQSEALWINFSGDYPFAIKVAAGKINAVTGEDWRDGLHRDPQDYMVAPEQPWLDGFCVEKGLIRQFVAMPLGSGYSAEEQLTGKAEHGGLQIVAFPLKREVYERLRPRQVFGRSLEFTGEVAAMASLSDPGDFDMGLGAGGQMEQEIYDDSYGFDDWDLRHSSRCFVHLANSMVWRAITGDDPPTVPPTSSEYTKAGLPWFDYYSDSKAVEGSEKLATVKSVAQLGKEKGDVPLPENQSVNVENVIKLRKGLKEGQVREGRF